MILKNLLIASDFSKYADWALQRALELATLNQAHLHFLHVLTPPLSTVVRSSDTELQPDYFSEKKEIEEQILKRLNESVHKLSATTSVISGRAADEIVRYAEDTHCSLTIVGSHGSYYINDYIEEN